MSYVLEKFVKMNREQGTAKGERFHKTELNREWQKRQKEVG